MDEQKVKTVPKWMDEQNASTLVTRRREEGKHGGYGGKRKKKIRQKEVYWFIFNLVNKGGSCNRAL